MSLYCSRGILQRYVGNKHGVQMANLKDGNPSFHSGEVAPSPITRYLLEQILAIQDWHPAFTGKCPKCERPMLQTTPPRVHFHTPFQSLGSLDRLESGYQSGGARQ